MANLSLENLSISFHSREGIVEAVEGVSLVIEPGEVVGLVGESGSGKSVTCNSVLRLLPSPPARTRADALLWKGRNLLDLPEGEMRSIRGKEISMIFQDPMSCLNPYLPVLDQVAEPLLIHRLADPREAKLQAIEMLARVGVTRVVDHPRAYPHEFSGGMRQRAMIAMALISRPDLLLADEPTTALDVTIQAQILKLMRELKERLGAAIILITHDLGVVAETAQRVVVMYAGRKVEEIGRAHV